MLRACCTPRVVRAACRASLAHGLGVLVRLVGVRRVHGPVLMAGVLLAVLLAAFSAVISVLHGVRLLLRVLLLGALILIILIIRAVVVLRGSGCCLTADRAQILGFEGGQISSICRGLTLQNLSPVCGLPAPGLQQPWPPAGP